MEGREGLRRYVASGPQPKLVTAQLEQLPQLFNQLVIWDGSPIHRAKEIKAFLKREAAKRLYLERLPGYAPELNPQEGVWNLLKRRELKNLCCRDLLHVADELRRAKERLRHRAVYFYQVVSFYRMVEEYPHPLPCSFPGGHSST